MTPLGRHRRLAIFREPQRNHPRYNRKKHLRSPFRVPDSPRPGGVPAPSGKLTQLRGQRPLPRPSALRCRYRWSSGPLKDSRPTSLKMQVYVPPDTCHSFHAIDFSRQHQFLRKPSFVITNRTTKRVITRHRALVESFCACRRHNRLANIGAGQGGFLFPLNCQISVGRADGELVEGSKLAGKPLFFFLSRAKKSVGRWMVVAVGFMRIFPFPPVPPVTINRRF